MDLLKNIDGKATQVAVEKQLRQYRTYQLTTPEEFLPTITPKYTMEMPSFGGGVHSKIESAAIKSVDNYREAVRFFEKFNRAFYKLSKKERQLIVLAYLDEVSRYNYEVASELSVAERTYFCIKQKAMYTLALVLLVILYQEDEVKSS